MARRATTPAPSSSFAPISGAPIRGSHLSSTPSAERVAVILHEPLLGGATTSLLRVLLTARAPRLGPSFWVPGRGAAEAELRRRGYEVARAERLLRFSAREPARVARPGAAAGGRSGLPARLARLGDADSEPTSCTSTRCSPSRAGRAAAAPASGRAPHPRDAARRAKGPIAAGLLARSRRHGRRRVRAPWQRRFGAPGSRARVVYTACRSPPRARRSREGTAWWSARSERSVAARAGMCSSPRRGCPARAHRRRGVPDRRRPRGRR